MKNDKDFEYAYRQVGSSPCEDCDNYPCEEEKKCDEQLEWKKEYNKFLNE